MKSSILITGVLILMFSFLQGYFSKPKYDIMDVKERSHTDYKLMTKWVNWLAKERPSAIYTPTLKKQVEKEALFLNQLTLVNEYFNNFINYKKDGVLDYWQSPLETWAIKEGDCEDIALIKYSFLSQYVPREKLRLAIVKDKNLEYHAILLVKFNKHTWVVLDNKTNEVWPTEMYKNYKPMYHITENKFLTSN